MIIFIGDIFRTIKNYLGNTIILDPEHDVIILLSICNIPFSVTVICTFQSIPRVVSSIFCFGEVKCL